MSKKRIILTLLILNIILGFSCAFLYQRNFQITNQFTVEGIGKFDLFAYNHPNIVKYEKVVNATNLHIKSTEVDSDNQLLLFLTDGSGYTLKLNQKSIQQTTVYKVDIDGNLLKTSFENFIDDIVNKSLSIQIEYVYVDSIYDASKVNHIFYSINE